MHKIWLILFTVSVLGAAGVYMANGTKRRLSHVPHPPAYDRIMQSAKAIHLYMEDTGRTFPLASNWQTAVQPYASDPVDQSKQPSGGLIEYNPQLSGIKWSAVYRRGSYPMLRDINARPGSDPQMYCTAEGNVRFVRHASRFAAYDRLWKAHPLDDVRIYASEPTIEPYVPAPSANTP